MRSSKRFQRSYRRRSSPTPSTTLPRPTPTAKPVDTAATVRAESWALRGAIGLLVIMVAALGWMRAEWGDTTAPVRLGTTHTTKVSDNAGFVTPAQQKFLDAANRSSNRTFTAAEWRAFQSQLEGRVPDPASIQSPNDGAIAASLAAVAPEPAAVPVVTPDLPGYKIAIDGSSTDALVGSINAITAALPDHDARVFQKSVRMLIVGSIPVEQLVAQHVQPSELTEARLLDGARSRLNGMKAMDVLAAATALHRKLVQQSQNHTGPFAASAQGASNGWGN